MAAAATAVKLHMRVSRLQEAAAVMQERAWVEEVAGHLAKKGKSLLAFMASPKPSSHGQSSGAAILGSSGLLLPSRPSTKSAGGIIPTDPVESLEANLSARRDHGSSSKVKFQFVHLQTAAASTSADGQGVAARNVRATKTDARRSPLGQSMEEEDYGWESDPNGGWLASFP